MSFEFSFFRWLGFWRGYDSNSCSWVFPVFVFLRGLTVDVAIGIARTNGSRNAKKIRSMTDDRALSKNKRGMNDFDCFCDSIYTIVRQSIEKAASGNYARKSTTLIQTAYFNLFTFLIVRCGCFPLLSFFSTENMFCDVFYYCYQQIQSKRPTALFHTLKHRLTLFH